MSERYKETLNLPNTGFPMKANLSQREPECLKYWDDINLFQRIKITKKGKPKFILPDGPPYANGAIHIGHAVNKSLKDFIIKSKLLSNYDAPFVPGWDCHGLPIEHNVEKEVGKVGVKIDPKTFRKKCREYVTTQIELQKKDFIRLGVIGDWENPYLTMDYQYEANTIRSLGKIIENGHLHKGYKPVYWCLDCKSALAEAEVEYQDKTSPSIYVSFIVMEDKHQTIQKKLKNQNIPLSSIAFVIWTTTPWTLPANEAVALNAELQYSLIQIERQDQQKNIIIASDLIESVLTKLDAKLLKKLAEWSGQELEGILLQHPFYERTVPVVLGEHVTLEDGTGCVHTAPAHGQDDYNVGQKYGLSLVNPVGSDGCYISGTPLLEGLHVLKANDKIIELLKAHRTLVHLDKITHSYPHCWRHKTPLIYRATQQWFISMEQNGLREKALQSISQVKWIPSWGQARIDGMIRGRPDWCVSRQRTWGVPMGLFVHKETGELHPETGFLIEKVATLVEKSGIDAWYDLNIQDLLSESEAKQYEKIPDTLDVWFDSGVMHHCVLEKREELQFPADLYLEGSDQHRGWFQSSLLTAVAMKEGAPYRSVLTHGFTVDAQGRKMSKSLGNVVLPDKVISTLGADVLRLWVSATDYRAEMPVSDEILQRTSDAYRRIRNTARFLLANLNGFEPKNALPPEKMLALDRAIVEQTRLLQAEIIKAYDEYQFHLIYQLVHNFCSMDLGSFYLDIIKDRQYTGMKEGVPRRSAQTALWHIIEALVRWVAPILSFTAEEIWQHMPKDRSESVFLSEWYANFPPPLADNVVMNIEYWKKIRVIRDAVYKALEEARNQGILGSGLEAEVTLFCDADNLKMLSLLEDELRFVLITSKALLVPMQADLSAKETSIPGINIKVTASPHPKCDRCWHRIEDVNHDPNYPDICGRCVSNIKGPGEKRLYA